MSESAGARSPRWVDMLTAAYFKRGRQGEYLFFPRGSLGPGYELPGPGEYEALRRRASWGMLAWLAALFAVVPAFGLVWSLAPAALALAAWAVFARRATRGLPVAQERMTTREGMAAYAAATPAWIRAPMVGVSAALALLGAVLLSARPDSWWVGAGAIAFGLLGIVQFAWLRGRTGRRSGRT